MTKEEFRAMLRVELKSILKEEFRNMLNTELRVPENEPPDEHGYTLEHGDDAYRDTRKWLTQGLHYFQSIEQDLEAIDKKIEDVWQILGHQAQELREGLNNVADAMWPGHEHQDQGNGNVSRPDLVLGRIRELERDCLCDRNYKDIRLSNIKKAVQHFKYDVDGLVDWLNYWSMCPYPEKPWVRPRYYGDPGEDRPKKCLAEHCFCSTEQIQS